MSLRSKSVQLPKEKKDGIRVCIMRRPDKEVEFDIWMPTLAPSHSLLDDYHAGKLSWEEFVQRYTREVIKKEKKYFKLLANMARQETITILCWEIEPQKCHRRLVAENCQKIDPTLRVTVR